MPTEPAATPPPPVVRRSGGSVLLVLGQRQFGIALGDALSLTGGSVTRADLIVATPAVCSLIVRAIYYQGFPLLSTRTSMGWREIKFGDRTYYK